DEITEAPQDDTDYQGAFNLLEQKVNEYREEFGENHPNVQTILSTVTDMVKDCCRRPVNYQDLRFCKKVLFILENSNPPLTDTEDISILRLDRIGSTHQQSDEFELALVHFARKLKIHQ
ncbi:unnamed protein product, partial [Didymodactylos carnosus]